MGSALAGAVTNFTVNKYWAFAERTPIDPRQVVAYALVSLMTALFVANAVHVLAVIVGVPYLGAKGIAAVLVFALWSYPAQARFVFPTARRAGAGTTDGAG